MGTFGGKVALVTGAARGLGRVTALAFALERTVPTDRSPRRASSRVVARPMPEFAPVVRATGSPVIR